MRSQRYDGRKRGRRRRRWTVGGGGREGATPSTMATATGVALALALALACLASTYPLSSAAASASSDGAGAAANLLPPATAAGDVAAGVAVAYAFSSAATSAAGSTSVDAIRAAAAAGPAATTKAAHRAGDRPLPPPRSPAALAGRSPERYLAVESPPAAGDDSRVDLYGDPYGASPLGASTWVGGAGGATGGEGLRRAMDGWTEALAETRRLLSDDQGEGESPAVEGEEEEDSAAPPEEGGQGSGGGDGDGDEGDGSSSNNDDSSSSNSNDNNNQDSVAERPRRPSSDWWERLWNGVSLYDEATSSEQPPRAPRPDLPRPDNRRSHSAAVYADPGGNEWMIISGGFADDEWDAFPVWAYDLTGSKSLAEIEGELSMADVEAKIFGKKGYGNEEEKEEGVDSGAGAENGRPPAGTWTDLSPRTSHDADRVTYDGRVRWVPVRLRGADVSAGVVPRGLRRRRGGREDGKRRACDLEGVRVGRDPWEEGRRGEGEGEIEVE
ncbi:hypothetical protein ACHAWF_013275 [Thalassiosira exigua]